jgi:hypothetical protein
LSGCDHGIGRYYTKHCREANIKDVPAGGLGTEISGLFANVGLYSDIPELRGHEIEPASFEEDPEL